MASPSISPDVLAFPGTFHAGQLAVGRHPARFRVLAAGRRWGKTRLAVALAFAHASRGERVWWVAPSYPMAQVGWRELTALARPVPRVVARLSTRTLHCPGGGWVQVRSADDPDSLRGEGLDFVVLDECAFMREEAWTQALRPALSDRQGRALFLSTPRGRNWYWRLWHYAATADDPAWQAFQFPTSTNPYIAPAELAQAQAGLPERIFRQEYLAEFLEDGGGIFRHVQAAATATPVPCAEPGHAYIIGVDWGKYQDWTVYSVLDVTAAAQVHQDRFHRVDYAVQLDRLRALAARYAPLAIVAERNAMGEPLVEQLQRDGLPIQAFTTTQASKPQLIERLALAFERGALRILPDPVLLSELEAYEGTRLPSGTLRYGAPQGLHDDCVMALALAWWGARQGEPASLAVVPHGRAPAPRPPWEVA